MKCKNEKKKKGIKWYRKKIVEMVGEIENEKHLKMIYGFVKRFHIK